MTPPGAVVIPKMVEGIGSVDTDGQLYALLCCRISHDVSFCLNTSGVLPASCERWHQKQTTRPEVYQAGSFKSGWKIRSI